MGKVRQNASQGGKSNKVMQFLRKYATITFAKSLLFEPSRLPVVTWAILLAELLLNVAVVLRVPYTEIDWVAYMQECEGFLNGTLNYAMLRGETGPLVYPAGFVYIYSVLYFLTNYGKNIQLAQYIFIGIYLMQMFLVLRIYSKSQKVPPYVLLITTFTSYRIHSIYVLRLFNDPVAIIFFYAALNCFLDNNWNLGSIFLSLGVSVKMNILLFAPAILLFYITNLGYVKTMLQLAICAGVQLLLGAPFLLTYPLEYIKGSFDLGRVFEHKWTVNYRFLSEEVFINRNFHIGLLLGHAIFLLVLSRPAFLYFQNYCRLRQLQLQLQPQIDAKNAEVESQKRQKQRRRKQVQAGGQENEEKLSPDQEKFLSAFEKGLKMNSTGPPPVVEEPSEEKYSIHFDRCTQLAILPIFLCNFIGIVFSRSLHYQFYVWYFHSLPYLVWCTDFRTSVKFLLLAVIEFTWNTYPSTNFSSLLLHMCHVAILSGISRKLLTKH
ncbi:lethal(2)neighbour of tid protein 2-like [Lutzomyia longipalpis]|uniref:lethal(2)neighbour of tid protein 2-like n=1 Tax=Lutzomyia longipalpis TaxID=7200 RepID=UPI0024838635|nr:lethal(2)neighbour of tid protein 2-like [Lutzomyia longipalpis]